MTMPAMPPGDGAHPVSLVVVSTNDLAAATAFYTRVFGWQAMPMSSEVTALAAASGPGIGLRTGMPDGFQKAVPFITVPDVKAALARVIEAGATLEKSPWSVPAVGSMARFRDPGGTVYGLTSGMPAHGAPVPMPFGSNPRPPVHTMCSLEMHAPDGEAAGRFFAAQFGWGFGAAMPGYVGFDPGAGIGGVFQSHTPASPGVVYTYVADVRATLGAIAAAGGTRMGDPMAVPGMGCFGYYADPTGGMMGLIGP